MDEMRTTSLRVWVVRGLLPGILLLGLGSFAHVWGSGAAQITWYRSALLVLGGCWVVTAIAIRAVSLKLLKNIVLSALAFLLSFGVAEALCSFIAAKQRLGATRTFWIYEDTGRTVQFDPIRGYRLTTTPSRFARVANGEIDYVGTLKGNLQGFPDKDDFSKEKPSSVESRYLVFGDSFSAAQYITTNWPDSIENQNPKLQLLNFSTDGGGLANWWSNLTRLVEPEGYEFDGVVFAVFADDLRRGFTIADHRGYNRMMQSRLNTWDPAQFPKTLEEAKRYLDCLDADILSSEEFSHALSARALKIRRPEQKAGEQKAQGLDRFWICSSVQRLFKVTLQRLKDHRDALRRQERAASRANGRQKIDGHRQLSPLEGRDPLFPPERVKMIEDMRSRLHARGKRIIVVHIPSREELLAGGSNVPPNNWNLEAQDFASALGAEFVDGAEAFSELSREEILADWLPVDGHWGQRGSDRFASFFAEYLHDQGSARTAVVSEAAN